MSAFYRGDYSVLISTAIIESGLDIPDANTMIIERADSFGLAQLHQLRGRIGRSSQKAYCYFLIPDGPLKGEAKKRLKALQTYTDLGSGFYLADSDLEIRGAGDILGAYQSGHVKSVGLELYMELLKEAVDSLKGKKKMPSPNNIEIRTPFSAAIPDSYINDSSLRMRYYKRLSSAYNFSSLEEMMKEIEDIFGPHPLEFLNLTKVLRIKMLLVSMGIPSLSTANNSIVLKLDKQNTRNEIIDYFLQGPTLYQFTPKGEVIYRPSEGLSLSSILEFTERLHQITDS